MMRLFPTLIASGAIAACSPTVKIESPDKPIEINLNINLKIDQEVRLKIDDSVEDLITNNPDLF